MSRKFKIPGTKYKCGRRWAVQIEVSGETLAYMEQERQYEFRVVDKTTGQIIMSFLRSEVQTPTGSTSSGVRTVEISDDEPGIIASYEDGHVERHALPASS